MNNQLILTFEDPKKISVFRKFLKTIGGISVTMPWVKSVAGINPLQKAYIDRLDYLKENLKEGWNEPGDLPIEEKAYRNTKKALSVIPESMLKNWNLFPDTNGTLMLSPKGDRIGGISIGNQDFSYAAYVSDDKQISGREPFSEEAFLSAIGQIHRLFGYA